VLKSWKNVQNIVKIAQKNANIQGVQKNVRAFLLNNDAKYY